MKTEESHLIAAAKIIASTLVTGIGAVGLYGPFYPASIHSRVGVGMLGLGLWLMVGAWTGRSILARLSPLYLWLSGNLGADSSKTLTEPAGELVTDKETRPA